MEGFLELKQQLLPGERQVRTRRFLLQAAPHHSPTQGAEGRHHGTVADPLHNFHPLPDQGGTLFLPNFFPRKSPPGSLFAMGTLAQSRTFPGSLQKRKGFDKAVASPLCATSATSLPSLHSPARAPGMADVGPWEAVP